MCDSKKIPYKDMPQELKEEIKSILDKINEVREDCKKKDLLNCQTYLDFEDELNKYSVMDPNQ